MDLAATDAWLDPVEAGDGAGNASTAHSGEGVTGVCVWGGGARCQHWIWGTIPLAWRWVMMTATPSVSNYSKIEESNQLTSCSDRLLIEGRKKDKRLP
jgi:hypothetical protein